jgi:hypothetical protein
LYGHQIGHQADVARDVFPGQDDGLLNGWVSLERHLDLPQLNAMAADLDLMINPTEKLEVAIWEIARQIPSLIEARSRLGAKGMREKSCRGEFGSVEIPLGQAGPPDIEFPGHANGYRLAVAVEHIDLRVGDGTTDGHAYRNMAP